MIFIYFLCFSFYTIAYSYSPFFNHWHCVGLLHTIDFGKPYSNEIGGLPLVFWKNKEKKIQATMNICKHMGSTLDSGKITEDGCLQCPYHGLKMDNRDQFGETMEHEGKLFWSYQPTLWKPYSTPFFNNPAFSTSFLQIDMPCSLQDSAYNTLDMHHPAHVHAGAFGFGNAIPPRNIKHWSYRADPALIGLSFDYKTTNMALSSAHSNYTSNYHMFRFPTFTWSKVSFMKEQKAHHLIISVDFLPITKDKTRWYVTIAHNYEKSFYKKHLVDLLALTILSQDKVQMAKQAKENTLKKAVTFQTTLGEEDGIWNIKKKMDASFDYPSVQDCADLYEHYKADKNKK